PQGTNSESGLQWAVLPKTMGNQVLLLDIPQILWNPPRKEGLTGWFKPTPIMKVNGVRISDFDQKRLELRIEVTTLFGISEIRFKIIQYSLAFFGFVLTYPLLIEYVKTKHFARHSPTVDSSVRRSQRHPSWPYIGRWWPSRLVGSAEDHPKIAHFD